MSIKAVYDTMLFFQFVTRPERIHTSLRAVHDGRVSLFLSGELLTEARDVLTRPEHQASFPALTPDAVYAFFDDLSSRSTVVDPVPNVFTWPQHPDDDHLFNLAIHSQAKYLVTWETRLLKLPTETSPSASLLKQFAPELEIITPKTLAEILTPAAN